MSVKDISARLYFNAKVEAELSLPQLLRHVDKTKYLQNT